MSYSGSEAAYRVLLKLLRLLISIARQVSRELRGMALSPVLVERLARVGRLFKDKEWEERSELYFFLLRWQSIERIGVHLGLF